MGYHKVIHTEKAPKALGPYSQAVELGGLIFCSGQIPLTAEGELVDSSIEDATEQVLKNIEAVLFEAGVGMSDVVKTTIFLTDLSNFDAVNTIYGTYFYDNPPARSTVEVSNLPKGAMVEIEVLAVKTYDDEDEKGIGSHDEKGGCGDNCTCND